MKSRTVLAAFVVLATGFGVAFAAGSLKEQREAGMKANGAAVGALSKIAKGETPYDAAVVTASLTAIRDSAKTYPDLFPSADAVEDKAASPKIWENFDDFKARSAKLAADADGLLAQLPADQAAVGAALKVIGPNCGGCHELYRIKE